MTFTTVLGVSLIVVAFGLAVAASIRIEREKPESQGQRISQWAFAWLVPFIGPLITIQLLRREPERSAGEYPAEDGLPDSAWAEPQSQEPSIDVDHMHD